MLGTVRKKIRHGEKGYTLIELLVAIAILGILSAVAIPNVTTIVSSAKLAAANNELATVQTAAITYAVDHVGVGSPADFRSSPTINTLNPYLTKPPLGSYHFDSQGHLVDHTTTQTNDPAMLNPADAVDPTYPQIAGWNATKRVFQN